MFDRKFKIGSLYKSLGIGWCGRSRLPSFALTTTALSKTVGVSH